MVRGRATCTLLVGLVAAVCVVGGDPKSAPAAPPRGKTVPLAPSAPVVSGTVSWRERIDLPGMAMLHVELLDASANAPASPFLGEDTVWVVGGKLPVSFRIAYDQSRIDPTHVYVLQARIMDGEEVLMQNVTPSYVLTRGAPRSVDIIVVPAQMRRR